MYGLIFDVDGVLADTEPVVEQATIEMFRDLYGVEMKGEDFRPYIGSGAVLYTQGPADAYGLEIDLERALEDRFKKFVRIMEERAPIDFPGVQALIDQARGADDWKLGIATSSPEDKSRATLRCANVEADHFEVYVTGDDITHKKPHPEIYNKAATDLGLAAGQCVVIEDAINGVQAAKRAGMACVAVMNTFGAEELDEADLVVGSLEEVNLERLRGLVEGG